MAVVVDRLEISRASDGSHAENEARSNSDIPQGAEKGEHVVKKELARGDLLRLPNGETIFPFWPRERLQNEAATLRFVASETTIPVPDCRLYTKDGLLYLETIRITDGVLLMDVGRASRAAAARAVEEQMDSHILPQLRSLRRKYVGSVDAALPVFPPQRVYGLDRRAWPQISSGSDEFVLCHNDLSPQNIFVDPDSFQIVGIIDWEFAGFFPSYFELPLWREFEREAGSKMYDEARPRDLGFFGTSQATCKTAGLHRSDRVLDYSGLHYPSPA